MGNMVDSHMKWLPHHSTKSLDNNHDTDNLVVDVVDCSWELVQLELVEERMELGSVELVEVPFLEAHELEDLSVRNGD